MNSKRALEVLKEHKALIDDEKYDKFFPWQQQAISYIDRFLGKESQEYEAITTVEFPPINSNARDLKLLRHVLQTNIDQAITTISKIGVYRVYHNFLCKYSDKELISGIIAVAGVIFGAGYWVAGLIHNFVPK